MELPKNITQIGESDRNCKIYVEDYVVSYIKQINQLACNKEMAVALYGVQKMEDNISYLFVYGACKLNFLQRETRHLSQAQQQEIERLRQKYFPEQDFLGYRLLNGEMVEGFHICEQDVCRYIMGYAQFYEKNDAMLAYMLDTRIAEVKPEVVNQEKYDVVKRRQEERREESGHAHESRERKAATVRKNTGVRGMRLSTVAVFGLLCVAGLAMLWEEYGTGGIQEAARLAMTELTEQKLPDFKEASTLITEEKLVEAVRAENSRQESWSDSEQTSASSPVSGSAHDSITAQDATRASDVTAALDTTTAPDLTVISGATVTCESTAAPGVTATPDTTAASNVTTASGTTATSEVTTASGTTATSDVTAASGLTTAPGSAAAPASTPAPVQASTSYVIQKGDTLIGICIRQYGTEKMVQEVCALNHITDPDDIKMGEKILLP